MNDTCMACGRPIFTIPARNMGITLAQQWTHGGFGLIDRQHSPIPQNYEFKVTGR
jgi:hypothetical protein